jgi:hypothetical protein
MFTESQATGTRDSSGNTSVVLEIAASLDFDIKDTKDSRSKSLPEIYLKDFSHPRMKVYIFHKGHPSVVMQWPAD